MSAAPGEPAGIRAGSRAAPYARFALALLIVIPLALRASVTFNPLPFWDSDPLSSLPLLTGLTPAGSMLIDVLVLTASAGALAWGLSSERSRATWLAAMLGVIGAGACAYWVYLGGVANARLASTWGSGIVGAAAMWALLRSEARATKGDDQRPLRASVIALLLGFVALLAVKGAMQYFVEHDAAVAHFKNNRVAILASSGWQEGSSMARAYERRLLQNEATGWFGLANAYATFAAASSVALVFITVGAWRAGLRGAARLVLLAGVSASIGALVLAGAKGGLVACAVGGLAAAGAHRLWSSPRASWAGVIGPALVLLACAGVVARGLLGERVGELSLLVRWFYWQGAAKMGLSGGVGPGGFQDAYLLAKPPLSTEEVQSAHNLFMDWFGTMGAPALASAGVVFILLWRAGHQAHATHRPPAPPSPAPPSPPSAPCVSTLPRPPALGVSTRLVAIGVATCTLAALMLDRALLTEDVAVVRVAGMIAWLAIALGVTQALHWSTGPGGRWARAGLLGAAIVLAVHAMIEVTATQQQAAGLWWVMLAACAAGGGGASDPVYARANGPGRPRLRRTGAGLAAVCVLVIAGVVAWALPKVFQAEAHLRAAAEACAPVAEVRVWMQQALAGPPADRADARQRVSELVAALARPGERPERVMPRVEDEALARATEELAQVQGFGSAWNRPGFVTAREQSRLLLQRAGLARTRGDARTADACARDALILAKMGTLTDPSASSLVWYATVLNIARASGVVPEADPAQPHGADIEWFALMSAQALDPYNPMHAQRALALAEAQGWNDRIRGQARELLRLDDLQRLDRETRGLPPAERARVEALARDRGT